MQLIKAWYVLDFAGATPEKSTPYLEAIAALANGTVEGNGIWFEGDNTPTNKQIEEVIGGKASYEDALGTGEIIKSGTALNDFGDRVAVDLVIWTYDENLLLPKKAVWATEDGKAFLYECLDGKVDCFDEDAPLAEVTAAAKAKAKAKKAAKKAESSVAAPSQKVAAVEVMKQFKPERLTYRKHRTETEALMRWQCDKSQGYEVLRIEVVDVRDNTRSLTEGEGFIIPSHFTKLEEAISEASEIWQENLRRLNPPAPAKLASGKPAPVKRRK